VLLPRWTYPILIFTTCGATTFFPSDFWGALLIYKTTNLQLSRHSKYGRLCINISLPFSPASCSSNFSIFHLFPTKIYCYNYYHSSDTTRLFLSWVFTSIIDFSWKMLNTLKSRFHWIFTSHLCFQAATLDNMSCLMKLNIISVTASIKLTLGYMSQSSISRYHSFHFISSLLSVLHRFSHKMKLTAPKVPAHGYSLFICFLHYNTFPQSGESQWEAS
jgi:hypothetical protein